MGSYIVFGNVGDVLFDATIQSADVGAIVVIWQIITRQATHWDGGVQRFQIRAVVIDAAFQFGAHNSGDDAHDDVEDRAAVVVMDLLDS